MNAMAKMANRQRVEENVNETTKGAPCSKFDNICMAKVESCKNLPRVCRIFKDLRPRNEDPPQNHLQISRNGYLDLRGARNNNIFNCTKFRQGSSFSTQSPWCVENEDPLKSLGNGWKLLLATSRH